MGRRLVAKEKAEKLLSSKKVFEVGETEKYKYYICGGSNGNIYNIVYNKRLGMYDCDCKNIRPIDCSHIIASRKLQNENYL